MSFESLWPHLSALHGDATPASAVEWKVLYASRPRPLLVPAACASQARAAIDFFVANRILRWWGHLMLLLDRFMPRSRLLPLARSERFPTDRLFGEGAALETRFAVHCGSPGPFRKLTIFCPPKTGSGNGEISKVASQESADHSVTREVYWLRTLGNLPSMARYLPRLLREGTLPCGRRFLTMSVLPFGAQSSRFGEPHFQFLRMLAERDEVTTRWSASVPFRRLSGRIAAVSESLDPQYRVLFDEILRQIDEEIGRIELPACLVHGDFAPWNVRIVDGQLLVFDWEYAEARGNPLHDFLHFHLVTRATRHRTIGIAFMRKLLDGASDHASRTFGRDSGVVFATPVLTLHYLLDTVAFYTEASKFLDINDSVVRTFLEVLEQRDRWLPQPMAAFGALSER